MKIITMILVLFVILFHMAVFVVEAFLWMNPAIYEFSIQRINAGVDVSLQDQALILKTVFVNQGFYNLFLAFGGVLGLSMMRAGRHSAGKALIAYMCLFATGAGIVLAITAQAYIGAFLQGGVAALAFIGVFFGFLDKKSAG